VWVTTQSQELVNFSRMEGIWVQFYPKIKPGDPDISYDVMCQGDRLWLLGCFSTEGRALQVRNEVIQHETDNVDYTVTAS